MNWHDLKNLNSAEDYVFNKKKMKNEMEICLESIVGSTYRILKVVKAKCRLQLLQVVSNFTQKKQRAKCLRERVRVGGQTQKN